MSLFFVGLQLVLKLVKSQFDRSPERGSVGKSLYLIMYPVNSLKPISRNVNGATGIVLVCVIFVCHATITERLRSARNRSQLFLFLYHL